MEILRLCLLACALLFTSILTGQDCSFLGPNLFLEGTFGSGPDNVAPDTPFIAPSGYVYTLSPPPQEGEYTITNNTAPWAAAEGWLETTDNSGFAEGYMMVVNAVADTVPFWENTLNLCGDSYYLISLDAINLQDPGSAPAAPPRIQVIMDGAVVADFGDLPQDGQWYNLNKLVYVGPGGGNVSFQLVNLYSGDPGNDFAVDNISLQKCGPEFEVRSSSTDPLCPGDRLEFEVSLLPGFENYWFQWQISTDDSQNWVNIGDPVNEVLFLVEDLPPGASFRVILAASEAELYNDNCIVYSDPILIEYQDPAECSEVIRNIGEECMGELGANVLPNGDFGSGPDNVLPFDPGFAPGYSYAFNPPPIDGAYTVSNNTAPWGSFADGWIDIGDNSADPEGYMMVVNAGENPGLFFVDTVEACGNTNYEFSADIISLNQPDPDGSLVAPNISFLVNGVAVFNTGSVPIDSSWHSYRITFTTSVDVTELALALRSNTPGGIGFIGNDLAVDNIALRPCGPEASVFEADAGPYCPGSPVAFGINIGSGYADPVIQWQYSTDAGATWQNSGSPVSTLDYTIPSIPPDAQVRALVAASEAGLESANCRVVSNVLQLQLLDINTCFEIPVTVEGAPCGGQYGDEIFPEGSFGSGPDVFGPELPAGTTGLAFQNTTWPNDGFYALMNFWDQDICEGFFPEPCWILPITDNSDDPQGYGMVVNATAGETGIFYTATIDGLCENTTYQFSADILNLNSRWFYPYNTNGADTVILPNIDFVIGNAGSPFEVMQIAPEVYNTGDILNDSTWNNYGFSFTTEPGVNAITFALRNNAPGGGGNDFILDNISFRMCGEADINRADLCIGDAATLEAVFDSNLFPAPAIQWQLSTDGGLSWAPLPGETAATLMVPDPIDGDQYRFLLAGSPENLDSTFCRLISAVDTISFLPQPTTDASAMICNGESFTMGDSTFTQTGTYDVYFTAANGCDSIVTLGLTVLDTALVLTSAAICQGDTYSFQGAALGDAGTYTEVLAAANGCDSTIILDLTVNPVFEFYQEDTICEGESFFFEGQEFTQPGDYMQGYQTVNGCDSIFRLSLTVLPILRDTLVEGICQGETYPFGSQQLDTTGEYERIITGSNGCDSIITLQLTVNPVYEFNFQDTICEGDSFFFEGQELSQPGDYQQQYLTAEGCDSTINLSLTVIPLLRDTIVGEICEGESYSFGPQQLTAAGTYDRAEPGSNGCDSIITLELIVHPNLSLDIEATICEGETYPFDGQSLSAPGNYSAQYATQFGCDSIVTLALEVLPLLRDTVSVEICEGESYTFDGQALSMQGVYEAMETGSNGCDSITTLLLTVWPEEESMAFQSICEGESVTFGGQELNASGTYQHTFSTIHGCDSLVTLELEVLPVATESLSVSVCEGETYMFGTQVLSEAGTYQRTVPGSNGCDSIITLGLTILPTYDQQVGVELCRGDVLVGQTVLSDTTIIFEGQTAAGCDSVVTYSVDVEDLSGFEIEGARPLCNDFTVTLSAGSFAGYAWSTGGSLPELVVSSPGWYTVTVTSQRGCTAVDSALVEAVAFTPDIEALDPLCNGDDSGAIRVTNIEGGSPPFLYSIDNGVFMDSSVFNGLMAGAYQLAIQDASGCEWTETFQLADPPPVAANIIGTLDISLGDSTQLRVTSLTDSLASFDWQPPGGLSCADCPNPVASPGESVTYLVTVADINGCPGQAQIEIFVRDSRKLYVPNAFSPNEDGRNDVFTVYPDKGVARIIRFQVFDRWGNKVFDGEGGGSGQLPRWDGTFKGEPLNPAVFVWTAEVEFIDGSTKLFEGEVSLVR
ncbi:MAG: gliding motility-associated C-terminal domain-containing protein [Lewinellaceae bacterium]|nr:gliding motility-associated C-terminal domain-containing protein [Lewinellaceae bacterium]